MTRAERTASGVQWWLAAEPLGDDVVWALTRVEDGVPTSGPVAGGIRAALGRTRELAASALPAAGALWEGPLTDPRQEQELAVRLGSALLPDVLREHLRRGDRERPDTVTVAVRGWLARVPWDCLALGRDGPRLLECARVLGGLPATLRSGRARQPDRSARGAPVRVVDPGARHTGGPSGHGPLYPGLRPPEWSALLADGERLLPRSNRSLTPEQFGAALRDGAPARLTYFGHAVAGEDHVPAAAALVFGDETGEGERRLTAFDWLARPDAYPAPPRVAVIGCGSDDSGPAEQSGLPIAAINAGAELVTATRWVLPMDPSPDVTPTTALGVAVDTAHGRPEGLDALRAWQLDRLDSWRRYGSLQDTPLLWASLVTYEVPAQDDP